MPSADSSAGLEQGRIRVLFIVPSLRRAGAEKQIVDLANGLSDRLFDKHILCYVPDLELSEQLDHDSVQLHVANRRNRFDWKLVKHIRRLIDEHRIDIVHCTLQNALMYGSLAAMIAKRPAVTLIAAIHTTTNVSWKYEVSDRLLYQWFLRRCSEVWFVCDSQREFWIQKYPVLAGKSFTIFNGVDSKEFRPAGSAGSAPSSVAHVAGCTIACIAAFRPEKSHDILLQAFAQVLDRDADARLLLAGDGPTRNRCVALAASLGISESVEFLGQVADVRSVVLRSDCTVLASTAVETFSIAMLESMAMGIPVVATDIGGAGEAIEHGRNGYLVPPADIEALAGALGRIANDRGHARELGARARQTVIGRFDTRRMAAIAEQRLLQIAKCADARAECA